MALFFECMLECAQKALDAADIVRDGDITTACNAIGQTRRHAESEPLHVCRHSLQASAGRAGSMRAQ
jgi:hypothetical protein